MHQGVVDWARATVLPEMLIKKRVLEVGSADWSGSMRDWFERFDPLEYHGIDLVDHKGVDEVLSANDLLESYGPERWDLVLCLEMLEHAEDWQDALYQMKASLDFGGWLVLTTRSPTYPLHFEPDHWRFTKEVLREATDDMAFVETWTDPGFSVVNREETQVAYYHQPGVFLRAMRTGPVHRITVEAEPAPTEQTGEPFDPIGVLGG